MKTTFKTTFAAPIYVLAFNCKAKQLLLGVQDKECVRDMHWPICLKAPPPSVYLGRQLTLFMR